MQKRRLNLLIAACLCVSAPLMAKTISAPAGIFEGISTENTEQYRGIPYAKAPIGELRWKAPQPKEYMDHFSATTFGNKCAQPVSLFTTDKEHIVGNEDCLYLNVYVPQTDKKDLPVMVWIHGGGHITGFGDQFDTSALTANQNVITVTFNYRLGPLGYLSNAKFDDASGNFGLLDQQLAMKWVKENIHSFGGDEDNITLFGESAGGMSTGAHILTPSSKPYFNKAIIQSGPFFNRVALSDRSTTDNHGELYAKRVGCDEFAGEEFTACMQDVPVAKAVMTSGVEHSTSVTEWGPVYQTAIIPQNPRQAFASGEFNQVPVINGSNLNEGNLFAHYMLLGGLLSSFDALEKMLGMQYGQEKANQIVAAYDIAKYKTAGLMYADIMTDSMFACPSYFASTNLARFADVYTYEFTDTNAPIIHKPHPDLATFGAYHASDIVYVLQTDFDLAKPGMLNENQSALSDEIQTYWANFAKNGTPNRTNTYQWKKADDGKLNVLNLNPNGLSYVFDFAKHHHCDVWEPIL